MPSIQKNSFRRLVLATTLVAFASTAMPAVSYAGIIGTAEVLRAEAPAAERAANLAKVEAGLARADVRAQLQKFGVDATHAAERAAALDDAQLADLAGRMDALPAGGDGILVVIGVVFIVLIILDYVGAIDIFKR
jgi:hypothetical protein